MSAPPDWPGLAIKEFYRHVDQAVLERLVIGGGVKHVEEYAATLQSGRGLKKRIVFNDGVTVAVMAELVEVDGGIEVRYAKETEKGNDVGAGAEPNKRRV